MLTVSNTSPISNLASIGRLQLFKSQFETVWIPDAVSSELLEHPDPEARQSIQNAGLAVTGVLGILLRAKRTGEIPAVKAEMDLLRSKAHFFISAVLEAAILRAAGE